MVENILKVDLGTPKDKIKDVLVNAASAYDVTLGGGIESVSIVSSIGSASINGDTLYLDFPAQDTEPFIINNQTVKGASITGADITFSSDTAVVSISSGVESVSMQGAGTASIDNGVLNISIPAAANFTVNGSEVGAMSVTGANVTTTHISDTAVVSISSNDFLINGDTVSGIDFGGVANVSIDSGIANVVINSTVAAGIDKVSVVGGDMNASVNNKTLYLYTPTKPNLQNPNFTVPNGITVPAFTNTTITADRLGDGYIAPVAQNGLTWNRINATQFVLKANSAGDYLAGMTLTETAQYYSAAKNIPVHVTSNDAMKILMHFDDQYNLIKNEGTANITSPASIASSYYSADGKFGGCLNNFNSALTTDITDFGARSFTFDLRQNIPSNADSMNYIQDNTKTFYWNIYGYITTTSYDINNQRYNGKIPITDFWTNWFHFAVCYDYTNKTLYTFINGKLDLKTENITFNNFNLAPKITNCKFDELRVLDGICAWTEDFTPPTEPY